MTKDSSSEKPKGKKLGKAFAAVTTVVVLGGGAYYGFGVWKDHNAQPDNASPQDNTSQQDVNPPAAPTPAGPSVINVFGQSAQRAPQSQDPFLNQWNAANERQQEALQDPAIAKAYKDYLSQFDQFRGEPLDQMARDVNRLVNEETTYTSDDKLYGMPEYWAAPVETAVYHEGDCEDYAILERGVLEYLNAPEDQMYIIGVNAEGSTTRPPDHAVLLLNEGSPQAPNYFILGDSEPVLPADNEIIGKTWVVESDYVGVPADFILSDARNDEGYWRVPDGLGNRVVARNDNDKGLWKLSNGLSGKAKIASGSAAKSGPKLG